MTNFLLDTRPTKNLTISPHISLSPDLLASAFPFHLAFNRDLEIVQAGEVLQRVTSESIVGSQLEEYFQIIRPKLKLDFDTIHKRSRSFFLLESVHKPMQIKGQMMYLESQEVMFFLCSLWVTDSNELAPLGVTMKDFAIHDPIADFLFLLQAKNTALADTQKLATELTQKQEQLKKTLELKENLAKLAAAQAQELEEALKEITVLNQRLKAENLRLSAELDVARQLQHMILPKEEELQHIADLEIAGFMEPAEEAGGDYYDVITYKDKTIISIGDVTGHGLESSILMIMAQTAVRTLLESEKTNYKQILEILNKTLYKNAQRMKSDKSMTLLLLDYDAGDLRFSGQHEEIIIVRSHGEIERIDTIDLGFPIGLDADITDFVAEAKVNLHPGDVVVLYTDGIPEAENEDKEHYGVERLCDIVQQNRHKSALEIRHTVIEDVRSHIDTHKVYDDITLVVIKKK